MLVITIFCCYGVTANTNMSSVGFAVIFGNKVGASWKQFWKFVVELHLPINSGKITIMTDQDKRQEMAISDYLTCDGHLHCSWHWYHNIMKKQGGGSSKTPYLYL